MTQRAKHDLQLGETRDPLRDCFAQVKLRYDVLHLLRFILLSRTKDSEVGLTPRVPKVPVSPSPPNLHMLLLKGAKESGL